MQSLKYINAYLELHGKKMCRACAHLFLDYVQKDISSGKITRANDRFCDEVDQIQKGLVKIINSTKDGEVVKIELDSDRKKHYEGILKKQGLGNLPFMLASGVTSLAEHHIHKLFRGKGTINGLGGLFSREVKPHKNPGTEKESIENEFILLGRKHNATITRNKKGELDFSFKNAQDGLDFVEGMKKMNGKKTYEIQQEREKGLSGYVLKKKSKKKPRKNKKHTVSGPQKSVREKDGLVGAKKRAKVKGYKKIAKVMKEFKEGKLHSGSKRGPIVKKRKQAIAIALSEQRKADKKKPAKKKSNKPKKEFQVNTKNAIKTGNDLPDSVINGELGVIDKREAAAIPAASKRHGMTASEMKKQTYTALQFNEYYKSIFGSPATNFDMLLYADPGTGKTVFLLKFADYLAENFGDVLYYTPEEYGAATLIDKTNRFNIGNDRLHFVKKLPPVSELKGYKFIFIDSVNHAKISIDQYRQMREDVPDSAFILILQQTKGGQHKGGNEWPHEVEIAIRMFMNEFKERFLDIEKDRYYEPRIVKI